MITVKLKKLMEKADIETEEELAEAVDVHRHTVANILDGHTTGMSFEVLDKFCAFFKCQAGDVLEYTPVSGVGGKVGK